MQDPDVRELSDGIDSDAAAVPAPDAGGAELLRKCDRCARWIHVSSFTEMKPNGMPVLRVTCAPCRRKRSKLRKIRLENHKAAADASSQQHTNQYAAIAPSEPAMSTTRTSRYTSAHFVPLPPPRLAESVEEDSRQPRVLKASAAEPDCTRATLDMYSTAQASAAGDLTAGTTAVKASSTKRKRESTKATKKAQVSSIIDTEEQPAKRVRSWSKIVYRR
jgi:hypothetical protein